MRKLAAIVVLVLAGCGGGGGGDAPATVATPVFSPAAGTYATVQSVTITCATAGAVIHVTTDGAAPTAASPAYAGPIAVTSPTTLKAMATAAGLADSAVATADYVLRTATPVISPAAGTYATAQTVTITSATPGAAIHVTTDGSPATDASPLYTAPIPLPLGAVATTTTVRAMAMATGFQNSAVASSTFVIDPGVVPAATPTFSPGAGSYATAQSVTIATTTPGATIHYTADGSTPTTASPAYAAPVQVAASLTLKAIATAPGFSTSAVGSASYVIGGGGTGFLALCNGLFAKMTNLFETCLQANPAFVPSLLGASTDFCADRQREITAGKVSYDPVAGAACEAAIQALDCTALSGDSGLSVPATCDASLVGQVTTGGECFDSADCADGYCTWELSTGTCPGTCQPFVQLNQPCDGADCAPGLECDGTTGSLICSAPSALGGSCPCQENLWCDRSTLPNTCRAFLPAGASCIPNGDPCTILTTCAGTPATCQPWLGAGATCDPADFQCGLGYVCSATTDRCVSWPTLGQACEGFCLGSWCDLTAVTPTCQAQKADGATCIPFLNGADCLSGSCSFTTSRCEASRCFMP